MADEDTSGEKDDILNVIRIKKYPNRRLYNTDTSSYIVLDDIVELVKSGKSFIIEDAKTGDDITRSILNQIIYERESSQSNFHFPLDVQKQLIMMYDDAFGQMMPDYMRESMNMFSQERGRMKDAFDSMMGQNSKAMVEFGENLARRNMEMFSKSFELFRTFSGMATPQTAETKTEAAAEKEPDRGSELEDIQSQIDALQDRLKSIK